MPRITQAQLEAALGGSAVAVQLFDKNQDGVADVALVAEVLAYAEAEADSAIQVVVQDMSAAALATSTALQLRELAVAVYWAWQRGSNGQAVPEHVKVAYEDALRWFDAVAAGKRSLGIVAHPAMMPGTQIVDIDPGLTRTTRANLKGFC